MSSLLYFICRFNPGTILASSMCCVGLDVIVRVKEGLTRILFLFFFFVLSFLVSSRFGILERIRWRTTSESLFLHAALIFFFHISCCQVDNNRIVIHSFVDRSAAEEEEEEDDRLSWLAIKRNGNPTALPPPPYHLRLFFAQHTHILSWQLEQPQRHF